jgi:hypothetical protein
MYMLKHPRTLIAALAVCGAAVGGVAHAASGSGAAATSTAVATPFAATAPSQTTPAPTRSDGHHCPGMGSDSASPPSDGTSTGSSATAPAV